MSQTAKKGDSVKVMYTGKLTDGTVFDSNEGAEPLGFEIGKNMVIPGFEDGVSGMAIDETKTIEIPCDQAYGEVLDEMIIRMPKNALPADAAPQVGQMLELADDQGRTIPVRITAIEEAELVLDANHPLAGQDLVFDVKLVAID